MPLQQQILGLFVSVLVVDAASNTTKEDSGRAGKLVPLFRVVRFPNDACNGAALKNGTCYTSEECNLKGGSSSGNCAGGFGVCCIFNLGCGSMSSENCTYFEAHDSSAGLCRATICESAANICQFRLDFETFIIAGPSTSTVVVNSLIGGSPSNINTGGGITARDATVTTQCLTDTFHVISPSGSTLPVICGTNTGHHVYLDSSDTCTDMMFTFGASGVGTSLPTRSFSIKISQFNCLYNNLAPSGCTQYFFGSNTGTVSSFNFENSVHLANQRQQICIRRERSSCRICYAPNAAGEFDVSFGRNFVRLNPNACCAYGGAGINMDGYDCIQIPAIQKKTGGTLQEFSRLCGRGTDFKTDPVAGPGSGAGAASTLCSTRIPFHLGFFSDNWEFAIESMSMGTGGFRVFYEMDAVNCP